MSRYNIPSFIDIFSFALHALIKRKITVAKFLKLCVFYDVFSKKDTGKCTYS